jgi:hypothetical protein
VTLIEGSPLERDVTIPKSTLSRSNLTTDEIANEGVQEWLRIEQPSWLLWSETEENLAQGLIVRLQKAQ